MRLTGPLDTAALTVALRAVRARHEALRTSYTVEGGTLLRHPVSRPPEHDLLLLPEGTDARQAVRALRAAGPLDATRADLLRPAVVPVAGRGDIYLALHHIAFDGVSGETLAADLARGYADVLRGEAPRLPPVPRHRPRPPDPARRAEHVDHWRRALAGAADLPDGGRDLSRRALLADTVVEHAVHLDAAEAAALRDRARAEATTPFAVLLTCYARVLAVTTGERNLVVGTAVADRPPGTEEEVGCLFTMVPVPVFDPFGPDAVTRVWRGLVDSVVHASLPLEEIVRAAGLDRGRRMPLYQAIFLLQNWPRDTHTEGPVALRTVPVPPSAPQAEILLELYDEGEGPLHGVLQAPSRSWWAARLPGLAGFFQQEARGVGPGPADDTRTTGRHPPTTARTASPHPDPSPLPSSPGNPL
jgi:hypothetical protein